jgi:hypothetical protein
MEYAAINFGSMSTNSDLWVAYVGKHASLHEFAAALCHGRLAGGHHVGVFESLAEAETWLASAHPVRHLARGMRSVDNA